MPRALIFTPLHTPQAGGYLFNHGHDHGRMELYLNKYQEHNLWNHAGLEQQVFFDGNVVIGDEMVPREKILESKFYKEWLAQDTHTGQMLGGIIFGMDSKNSMPSVCALMRGLDAPLISEKERNKMRLILPHISRSFGVMQRIQTAELAVVCTLSALDQMSSGVLLIDGNGSVAFANRSAKNILKEGDGLRLRKLSHAAVLGDLVAENAVDSKAISEAISATLSRDPFAAPHFSKCVSVRHLSDIANYTLQFSALGKHNEFGTFAAIVFIADGAQQINIDPTLLQSAYGLTPAEARVAVALLDSSSAQGVADEMGTSPLTVRTQIKHIYTKLGVDTRARFVKLMLSLARHLD